jgi:glutamine synthetase
MALPRAACITRALLSIDRGVDPTSVKALKNARLVAVCTPDNIGRLMGKRVPIRRLPEIVAEGMKMPSFHLATGIENVPALDLAVTGYHTGWRNGLLMPRPETAVSTSLEPRTAIVLADVLDIDGAAVAEAPTAILARQVDRLAAHGLRATVATELEFYLYRTSYHEAHARDYRDLEPYYHLRGGHDVLVSSVAESFAEPLRAILDEAGMSVESTLGESGVGQIEINLTPRDPAAAAYQHVLFKYLTKGLALREGLAATFMAKIDPALPGSSGHVHIHITDTEGHGIMGAAPEAGGDAHGLSPRGATFLAGVLAYGRDFQLLHMPYHNSFKRLQPHRSAPTNMSWAAENRTVMVRTLGHGAQLRLEFRLPGADMNPYFSIAGLLAAGVAGLEAGAPPPAPVAGNAYTADPVAAPPLVRTMGDAIMAFEDSAVAAEALTPAVRDHLAGLAKTEWMAELGVVTPWEIRRGFERA